MTAGRICKLGRTSPRSMLSVERKHAAAPHRECHERACHVCVPKPSQPRSSWGCCRSGQIPARNGGLGGPPFAQRPGKNKNDMSLTPTVPDSILPHQDQQGSISFSKPLKVKQIQAVSEKKSQTRLPWDCHRTASPMGPMAVRPFSPSPSPSLSPLRTSASAHVWDPVQPWWPKGNSGSNRTGSEPGSGRQVSGLICKVKH